jgi:hypothetical protein
MNQNEPYSSTPPAWATALGYAGLIPFVALSAAFFWPNYVSHAFISHALSSFKATTREAVRNTVQ